MIEVKVSGVRDGVGSDDDGVVFVFDGCATDEDLALIDKAIKRLGGKTVDRGELVTCQVCRGLGRAWGANPNKPCEACGGAGKVRVK